MSFRLIHQANGFGLSFTNVIVRIDVIIYVGPYLKSANATYPLVTKMTDYNNAQWTVK